MQGDNININKKKRERFNECMVPNRRSTMEGSGRNLKGIDVFFS